MQSIFGRLTANAAIKQTNDGRQLVVFSIAQNNRFKVKGSGEVKQVTNYFNCSYWLGTGIAKDLKKRSSRRSRRQTWRPCMEKYGRRFPR
jgi:single-strand DNA-binding protein